MENRCIICLTQIGPVVLAQDQEPPRFLAVEPPPTPTTALTPFLSNLSLNRSSGDADDDQVDGMGPSRSSDNNAFNCCTKCQAQVDRVNQMTLLAPSASADRGGRIPGAESEEMDMEVELQLGETELQTTPPTTPRNPYAAPQGIVIHYNPVTPEPEAVGSTENNTDAEISSMIKLSSQFIPIQGRPPTSPTAPFVCSQPGCSRSFDIYEGLCFHLHNHRILGAHKERPGDGPDSHVALFGSPTPSR